jgi:TolA-binding protein
VKFKQFILITTLLSLLGFQNAAAQSGEAVPPDLLMRWQKFQADSPDTGKVADLLAEGERIVERLMELDDLRRDPNKPPGRDYQQRIVRLQDRFKDLLYKIEMARLASLPDDAVTAMQSRYDQERQQLEAEIVALEDSIIARGEAFLESYKQEISMKHYVGKSEMICDFIYRLAEIYYRRAEDRYFITNDISEFKPAQEKYQRIIDEFPASDYVDDALYNIAYVKNNSSREVDRLEALRLYSTLINKYINSVFVPEAYWRIAEYNFYQTPPKLDEAIRNYTALLDYPESTWYPRGLYKIGWCYFVQADYPTAIDYFTQTVEYSLSVPEETEDILLASMLDEALEYISVCFAQDSTEWAIGGVEAAVAFVLEDSIRFATYGNRILTYLGDIYKFQIGNYWHAIDAYKAYLENYPLDANAPWVLEKIINTYAVNLREFPLAYDEKIRMFAGYRTGTDWDAANPEPEVRSAADVIIEKYYFQAINEIIGRAIQTTDPELLAASVEMSRAYLEFYPAGPKAYTVNYNLAVLLDQHVDQSSDAYTEYIRVSKDYEDESHRKEAAVNAVIIGYKLIQEQPPVPQDSLMGAPLSEPEQMYVDAVDNYMALFPSGEEAELFLLNVGGVYYNHGQYEDSRRYYNTLLETFPHGERRGAAYRYIMNGYFAEGKYAEAELIAKEIQDSVIDTSVVASARTRQAESAYLGAESMKIQGDLIAAAAEYKRTALENPDYPQAHKALFEAGITYQEAQSWTDANEVYLMLVERYPQSELADKSLYNVGYNSQAELGDKQFAAQTFERLATEYPESPLAQDALRNASINYVESEDWNGSIRANSAYVQMFPAAGDANLFLFEIAGLYLKLGDEDSANEAYAAYASQFPEDPRAVRARWERGQYLKEKGRDAEALPEFIAGIEAHRVLVAKGLTGEETYASRCLYEVIQSDYNVYASINFAPANAVEDQKTQKLSQRERLLQHVEELNQLAKDEMFEGLYMVGKIEEDLARAFTDQALPDRGRAEEKIIARETANQDAIEINGRATDAYADAAENIDEAVRVLRSKEGELERQKQDLSLWLIEAQKLEEKPEGISDSSVVLADIDRGLEEVREAIQNAGDWARRARGKVPELALQNAEIKFATVRAFLDLPDVGRTEELRTIYRSAVLAEFAAPRGAATIELYREAIRKAAFSQDEATWKGRALEGVTNLVTAVEDEYKALNERSLNAYAGNYNVYQELLNQGEGATTNRGLEAADIAEKLVLASDQSYEFAVAALNAESLLLEAIEAGDEIPAEYQSRFVASAIEESFRIRDRYAALAAEADEAGGIAQTLQDQSVVWEDALMTFEDCSYNFNLHTEEVLATAMTFNQIHGNDRALALRIGWALAELNREAYLPLLADYGEEGWVRSDGTFLVNTTFEANWTDPDFDNDSWEPAMLTGAGEGAGDLSGSLSLWITPEADTPVCDSVYVRKIFEITDEPVAGDLWISVDGGYSLQLNGEFIAAAEPGEGWTETAAYNVAQSLTRGTNTIALFAVDPDLTTNGIRLALRYKVLPAQPTGGP